MKETLPGREKDLENLLKRNEERKKNLQRPGKVNPGVLQLFGVSPCVVKPV